MPSATNSAPPRESGDPGPWTGIRGPGFPLARERAGHGLELHLRRLLRVVGRRERRHRLVAAKRGRGPEYAGERPQLGVVGAHRLDVVAPRDCDAVLAAFELRRR